MEFFGVPLMAAQSRDGSWHERPIAAPVGTARRSALARIDAIRPECTTVDVVQGLRHRNAPIVSVTSDELPRSPLGIPR
jgi:hypothetical protein